MFPEISTLPVIVPPAMLNLVLMIGESVSSIVIVSVIVFAEMLIPFACAIVSISFLFVGIKRVPPTLNVSYRFCV
jgi:hypothetical protein